MVLNDVNSLIGREISSRILENETEEVNVVILPTTDLIIKENIELIFRISKENKYMNNTYSDVTVIINPLNSNLFRDVGYSINNDNSLVLNYFDNNHSTKQIPIYPLSVWFYIIRNSFKVNNSINMVSFLVTKELRIPNSLGLNGDKTIPSNNNNSNTISLIAGAGRTRGNRPYMEDVDFVYQNIEVNKKQNLSIFGVLDGHGGIECSRYVGDEMPAKIISFMKNGNQPEEALHNSFLDIDKDFLKGYSNAGSTANCLLYDFKSNIAHIANTGDTRAVLCRSGKAIDLTMDRKATDPEEIARIIKEGGFVSKGRVMGSLAVSRAIGDSQLKNISKKGRILIPDPEITKYKPKMCIVDNDIADNADNAFNDGICKDEFIIIATDGLWDVLTSQAAIDLARDYLQKNDLLNDGIDEKTMSTSLSKIANTIADRAVAMGSQDNVTVMIIRICGLNLENGYCDDDNFDIYDSNKTPMLKSSSSLSNNLEPTVFNKLPSKFETKIESSKPVIANKSKGNDDDDMMDFLLDDSNF